MAKKIYLNRTGSVDDIRSSIDYARSSGNYYSVKDLKFSIADERRNKNRATVIKMLQAEIKRLSK